MGFNAQSPEMGKESTPASSDPSMWQSLGQPHEVSCWCTFGERLIGCPSLSLLRPGGFRAMRVFSEEFTFVSFIVTFAANLQLVTGSAPQL